MSNSVPASKCRSPAVGGMQAWQHSGVLWDRLRACVKPSKPRAEEEEELGGLCGWYESEGRELSPYAAVGRAVRELEVSRTPSEAPGVFDLTPSPRYTPHSSIERTQPAVNPATQAHTSHRWDALLHLQTSTRFSTPRHWHKALPEQLRGETWKVTTSKKKKKENLLSHRWHEWRFVSWF